MCLCDLIGACWGSRDTNVRVSTFLWPIPISPVTPHVIYYLSTKAQEGLHVAEWQLWFGLKPPALHQQHLKCSWASFQLHIFSVGFSNILKIQLGSKCYLKGNYGIFQPGAYFRHMFLCLKPQTHQPRHQITSGDEGHLLHSLTLPLFWPTSCTRTHRKDVSRRSTTMYVLHLREMK